MTQETPASDSWQWPACPDCRQRRQAVCPMCHTGGDSFPLAEFPESGPGQGGELPVLGSPSEAQAVDALPDEQFEEEILMMCTECEEAFSPRFYRLCQQCGYDFGEGIKLATPTPTELNPRVMMVLAGVAALLILSLLYFSIVLSS